MSEAAPRLLLLETSGRRGLVAVAAVARWEDSGVVDRWKCLRTLFTSALSQGSMTPMQVTALTTLLDSLDLSLVEEVVHGS